MNSIIKHVDNLIEIFGLCIKTNEYKLKLFRGFRRIEFLLNRAYVEYCNGTMSKEEVESFELKGMKKLLELLEGNKNGIPIEFNDDPRGYAIKIPYDYVRQNELKIYTDMGGYGIIVPEF